MPLKGLGVAMIAVMWPYDGWINIAPVAEEIREPQRNVPRGLAIGMLIVVVVYVGANISYHLTLPMDRPDRQFRDLLRPARILTRES